MTGLVATQRNLGHDVVLDRAYPTVFRFFGDPVVSRLVIGRVSRTLGSSHHKLASAASPSNKNTARPVSGAHN